MSLMELLNNISRIILGALVGFVVAFFLAKHFLHIGTPIVSTPSKTVVVRLVTKIDTVYKKQFIHDTISFSKPTTIKVDTVFLDGTKVVESMPKIKRVYENTYKPEDSVSVKYTANVTGTLDNIKFDYKNTKSLMVIHKQDSIFTTTTIKNYPAGIFLGVDAGYNQITPKIEVVKNKNSFNLGYNIITKTPQIGYSRRIF